MAALGYIYKGRYLEAAEYYAERAREDIARSKLAGPMVISDYTEVANMADGGKIYTSKAALRRSYRERGYVEVGNEKLEPPPKPAPDRKAIRAAAGKALNRVGISVDG